jgi:hypothetical protein
VPLKWIAESVFFVTIGGDLYEKYKKNERTFGEHIGKIISAVGVDALEQSKNFVQRLISNEAQGENCKISKSIDILASFIRNSWQDRYISAEGGKLDLGSRYSECGLFLLGTF